MAGKLEEIRKSLENDPNVYCGEEIVLKDPNGEEYNWNKEIFVSNAEVRPIEGIDNEVDIWGNKSALIYEVFIPFASEREGTYNRMDFLNFINDVKNEIGFPSDSKDYKEMRFSGLRNYKGICVNLSLSIYNGVLFPEYIIIEENVGNNIPLIGRIILIGYPNKELMEKALKKESSLSEFMGENHIFEPVDLKVEKTKLGGERYIEEKYRGLLD